MKFIRIINWSKFQHYKDRNPPWIKLHRDLMTSETWVSMDDAGRVLAIAIMMLAAATDNKIKAEKRYVQRVAYLNAEPDFQPLIDIGFIEIIDEIDKPASTLQADARPETEAYRTEEEKKEEADDTPARPPECLFSRGAEIAEITGWANDPNWFGNYSRVKVWIETGHDFDLDILPAIRKVMQSRKGRGPPASLNYFDRAVADAKATRLKPMPEGKPDEKRAHNPSSVDALFAGFAETAR